MQPERWQKIDQLFHLALEKPPGERELFLADLCAGDEDLQKEVEDLILSHEQAEGFIESPATDLAAGWLAQGRSGLKHGEKIGPYEVQSVLGIGGMGEVYLASDPRLGRQVALKILPPRFTLDPERVSRFEKEARAASALNHPNIVTIHEIGHFNNARFIVTEFVEGHTLRQLMNERPFTLNETLNVTIQVAVALSSAHSAGIVHRDIKPENIMLRADGYVKILDFGLAKLTETQACGSDPETPTLLQSNPGLVMGTVQYMSPEQARGRKVDKRTDIWSLGIVLYELVTGHVPFSGETPSHVMVSLMEDELPSLTGYPNVPAELNRIVTKALRKGQKDRYKSAHEFAHELKALKRDLQVEAHLKGMLEAVPSSTPGMIVAQRSSDTRAPATETISQQPEARADITRQTFSAQHLSAGIKRHKYFAAAALLVLLGGAIGLTLFLREQNKPNVGASHAKSIAVLPFRPIDSAIRDEIYEIGIPDSLIRRLSSIDGLVVRPLSVTRQYANPSRNDPRTLGREQQVDYVLWSSYRLSAGRIHIASQLFNATTGLVDVTYQSEKEAANVFAAHDAFSDEIAKMLMTRFGVTTARAEAKRGTTSQEAYRLYLQALNVYAKRDDRGWQQWVKLLDQAVSLDPNYALAWAAKAHAHRYAANLGRETDTHGEYKKSMEAINRALSLNKDLSEAYSALCENKYYYEFDFAGAETACKRAVALDPNSSQAHEIYGRFLYHRGRFPEGIKELETAVNLEPSLVNQRSLGIAFYHAGLYDKAQAQFKRAIAMNLNFASAYSWFRNSLEMQGNFAEAFDWFIQILGVLRADLKTIQFYQRIYKKSGYQAVLREYVGRFEKDIDQYYLGALLEADVGNKEKAFEYLEIAYQRREWGMNSLLIERRLDPLRDDPRFAELVRRIGLK